MAMIDPSRGRLGLEEEVQTKNRTYPSVLRQCGYLVRIGLPVPEPMSPQVGLTRIRSLCVPRFRVVCPYRPSVIVYTDGTSGDACQE